MTPVLRSEFDLRSLFERRSPVDRRSSSERVSTPLRRSEPDRRPPLSRLSSSVIAVLRRRATISKVAESAVNVEKVLRSRGAPFGARPRTSLEAHWRRMHSRPGRCKPAIATAPSASSKRSRPPAGSAGGRVGRRLLARCKRRGDRKRGIGVRTAAGYRAPVGRSAPAARR